MVNATVSKSSQDSQSSLNTIELEQHLNREHPLFQLAKIINWNYFEKALIEGASTSYQRAAFSTCLMLGLHYLKAFSHEDDESVIREWLENPYWQFFCGETTFQHSYPCHPSDLAKWRKQIGSQELETLLQGIVRLQSLTQIPYPNLSSTKLESKQNRILTQLTRSNSDRPFDPKERQEAPLGALELSSRERDILKLIMDGAKNKEIAKILYLAEGTVRNHVSNILSQLNVRDRTQAAMIAISFPQILTH